MSYKFTNSLRFSELCECNMAALNWCIFRKNQVVCHQWVPKILTFGSHCSANFQPILDCFIPKFKLEYDGLENIKTDSVNTVVFSLHQIKRLKFFWDTRHSCTKFYCSGLSTSELSKGWIAPPSGTRDF